MPWYSPPEPPAELSDFRLHKLLYDVAIEGETVPRLRVAFYRRVEAEWIHSVGIYVVDGVEVLRAGGLVGAEHCSWYSVPRADGEVDGPHPGCPDVRMSPADGAARDLIVRTPRDEYRVGVGAAESISR